MEITNIKPNERTIEILHPGNDRPIGIRVTLMAISDPRMKKIRRQILDARLKLEARNKHFKADEIEENQNRLVFNAMTGWEWYNPTGEAGKDNPEFDVDAEPTLNGEAKPAFNQKNVNEMCNVAEWFVDQISEAISEEKAFFTNSKAN